MWLGIERKRSTFCFSDKIELLMEQAPSESTLLPTRGRYDFSSLADSTGLSASELNEQLWTEVWKTAITNDTAVSLRKGIETGFSVPSAASLVSTRHRRARRGGFNQWRNSVPFTGNWFSVPYQLEHADAIEQDKIGRARVRILLDRYGIVFRELVNREAGVFQWRSIFRSLRFMELSGEVLSGYFFTGILGPQFISPIAFRSLQRLHDDDDIYWINAIDPISSSGFGGLNITGQPRRIPSNYVVYHGSQVVLNVEKHGKTLTFNCPPTSTHLTKYFTVLRHILYRSFTPKGKVVIESINDVPAIESPYLEALEQSFDIIHDHKSVYVQRELSYR